MRLNYSMSNVNITEQIISWIGVQTLESETVPTFFLFQSKESYKSLKRPFVVKSTLSKLLLLMLLLFRSRKETKLS